MKLNHAMICIDCDCVFDGRGRVYCPDCTSETVISIGAWLGGPIRQKKLSPIALAVSARRAADRRTRRKVAR